VRTTDAAPTSRATGVSGGLARGILFHRLGQMHTGRIAVIDQGGTTALGPGGGLQATVTVLDPALYSRMLLGGALAASEAYMDGQWEVDDLTSLCRILLRNADVMDGLERGWARVGVAGARLLHWLNRNTIGRSRANIHAHYDLGNSFFQLFLDDTMTYSCGIFEHPDDSMRAASIAKIDRLCRKLELGPADHLLEIGTGWGAFAVHAAANYGCRVTTTTISREQHDAARERFREAGVADRVTLLLEDYRNLRGQFDKLVSVEMIEAVGREFLPGYFAQCSRLLRPDGLMALQAIMLTDHRYDDYCRRAEFIQRHVFPGSHLPAASEMLDCVRRHTDLALEHFEDISDHYARTLRLWRDRFRERAADVRRLGHGERFIRLWDYYLSYCEAGFLERNCRVAQWLLAKPLARRANLLGAI
jgi:cyclopropane-fatty-acyl-phospholipid synthase